MKKTIFSIATLLYASTCFAGAGEFKPAPSVSGGPSSIPVPVIEGGTSATDAATARQNLGIEIGIDVQAWSNLLDSISALLTNGLLAKTGSGFETRTITGTTNQVDVANGDGIASDPVLSLPQDIHTGASPTFDGLTVTGDIYGERIAVGSDAVFGTTGDTTRYFDFSQTLSDFSGSAVWSPLFSKIIIDPLIDLTGGNAKTIFPHNFTTVIKSGNAQDIQEIYNNYSLFQHDGSGNLGGAISLLNQAVNNSTASIENLVGSFSYTQNLSTGTVNELYGAGISVANTGGGNVANSYGIAIFPPEGFFPNDHYGLFIDNQNVSSNAYSIYSNGGKSYFKDSVGIGVTAPRGNFELRTPIGAAPMAYFSAAGINHILTDVTENDVFGRIRAKNNLYGGLIIDGFSGLEGAGLNLNAYVGSDAPEDGVMIFNFAKSDGAVMSLGASELGLRVQNNGTDVFSVLGKSVKINGRVRASGNTPTASASSLNLGYDGNFFPISGNATIDYISNTDWDIGSTIILQFSGAPTMRHNAGSVPPGYAAILLAGGLNFGATANDTLTLVYNGTNWVELARTAI